MATTKVKTPEKKGGKKDKKLTDTKEDSAKKAQEEEAKKTKQAQESQQRRESSIKNTEELQKKAEQAGQNFANTYVPQGTFGTQTEGSSPEMQALLRRLNEIAIASGQYTGLENESIAGMRNSLGGYTAPELQAQREAALSGVNQDLATQMRMQELAAARNRVRGAAAMAGQNQLQQNAQQVKGNIARDIFIKNADEQQRRREAFNNLIQSTEAARFGRQTTANQNYGAQLGGEENVQRAIQQFNIGQRQNEALARSGAALSGAGVFTGLYGGEQGANITENYMNKTNDMMKQYYDMVAKQSQRIENSGM